MNIQLWGFICILIFIDQASFGKGSISLIILFKEKTWLFQKGENDILCLIAAILGNTYGCLNTSIFTYTLARKSLLINRLYPLAFSLLERNLKKYYYHSYRNWQDWNWRDRSSETTFLRLNICVPYLHWYSLSFWNMLVLTFHELYFYRSKLNCIQARCIGLKRGADLSKNSWEAKKASSWSSQIIKS